MGNGKEIPPPKPTGKSKTLRSRAEKRVARKKIEPAAGDPIDTRSLIHELEVHQVELELQNQELQQAHLEAEAARRKYFDLYELAPVGYATLTEKGEILEINRAGAKLLGQEPKYLVRRRFQLFVVQEDVPAFNRFNQSVFLSGNRESCELTLANNGNPTAEVRLEGIRGELGELKTPVCQTVFTDVTEQKQLQRKLLERQEQYLAIFNKSPLAISLTKMPGRTLEAVNEVFLKLFEYTWDEIAGRTSIEMGISDPESAAQVAAELKTHGSVRNFECRRNTKSGNQLTLSLNQDLIHIGGEDFVLTAIQDITVRKRAEEALAAARLQLQSVIDGTTSMIYACDLEARFVLVNTALAALLKSTPEQMLGKRRHEFMPQVDADAHEAADRKVVAAGEAVEFEEHSDLQGRSITWLSTKFPLRDAQGRIYAVAGIVTDITARQQAEEALERLRNTLAEAQKIAHLGSFEYIAATQTTVWSEEEYRIYGLDPAGPSPAYDVMLRDCIHPDDAALLHETFTKAMQSRSVYELEHRIVQPDGSLRWVYDRANPYLDKDGNLLRYIGATLDITERKQIEIALRESEQRFRLALRNAPVSVAVQDRDLRYVWAFNQRTARPEEIIGRLDIDIFTPEEAAHLTDLKKMVLDEGIEIREQMWFDRPGGRIFLDVYFETVRDGKGDIIGVGSATVDLTPRKRIEEALQQSRADLARAQEVGQMGWWRLDVTRNVLTWSDENYRIFGISQGAPLTYESFLATVHPDDRLYVDAQWQAALRAEPYDIEHRIVANGEVKWVREKAYLEFDQKGQPLGGFGITQDITKAKDDEVAIRKLAQQRQVALDAAHLGWWHYDPITGIASWDDRCREIFGISDYHRPIDEFLDQIIHPQALKRLRAKVEAALNPNDPQTFTANFHINRPDGALRWIEAHGVAAFEGEGESRKAISFVGTAADITDRKKVEEALRESEAIYRAIGESIDYGIWICDAQGRNTYASESFLKLLGITQEECSGFQWGNILHPDDSEATIAAWKECVQTGEFWYREHRYRGADGQWHPILACGVPIRNKNGEIVQWAGINLDISRLNLAEENLRQNEARFRLLSETASRLLVEKFPQQAIEALCSRVMEFLDCQVFFNFLDLGQDRRLHLNAYAGIPEEEARRIAWLDYGVAVCGCVAQDGKRIVALDIFRTPDPRTDLVKSYGIQAYACHPLMAGDRVLGTLSFGTTTRTSFTDSELDLMETVAAQVALGLERKELIDNLEEARAGMENKVRERTAEVEEAWKMLRELTAKLISAEENQKKAIAQEIHDTLGSCLSGIKYKVENIVHEINDPENVVTGKLENLIPWIQTAIRDCRRIQSDLSPIMISDLGLLSTIGWFIRRFEGIYSKIRVTPLLEVQERDIPDFLKIVMYRLLQEAFNNIAKHSGTERILLRLTMDGDELLLEVNDYGRGFNPEEVRGMLGENSGLGLSSMRERVEGSGGRFQLESVIGKGTRISARWPQFCPGQKK